MGEQGEEQPSPEELDDQTSKSPEAEAGYPAKETAPFGGGADNAAATPRIGDEDQN